jgi:hypothetical protein
MATKVVHISDLSGTEADQNELGRLVVLEHPSITRPVTLEVLPADVEGLQAAERVVQIEYYAPGARRPDRLSIRLEDFNALARTEDMETVLHRAATAGQSEPTARGDGRRAPRGPAGRSRVNYATLEHAGEPHRGRITEAEKQLVRANLDEVNRRLAAKGMRTIDPADPVHAERYGLSDAG